MNRKKKLPQFDSPAHLPSFGESSCPFPKTQILKPVMILKRSQSDREATVNAPTQRRGVSALRITPSMFIRSSWR